jgi:AraC family transcriptional regulator, ethanolamine operon transcriptional activator
MPDVTAVSVEEITDPTVANAGIDWIDLDAVKLQSKPFRALRVTVRLVHATVLFHSVSLRLRTRTRMHEGQVAYVTFGAKARGTVNGMSVQPGMMLTAAADAEARFVVEAGWESVTFLLPPSDINTHLRTRQRESEFRQPCGLEVLQVQPEKVRALFDWGKRLARTVAARPALFAASERERAAAEVELVETLLTTLGAADDFRPTRSDRSRQAQSRIVRTAEDYALAHFGEPLYVTDLCRAAAVSERKLEYAFKGALGLTPVAFLIRLRLHRARQSLLAAVPGSTTVAAEALRWGFWHFGEFSRAYKDCFAELPSETLRRKQPDTSLGGNG